MPEVARADHRHRPWTGGPATDRTATGRPASRRSEFDGYDHHDQGTPAQRIDEVRDAEPGTLPRPGSPPDRPPLRVVPPATRPAYRTNRRRLVQIAGALAVGLSCFALASVHAVLTQGQFTLHELEARAAEQEARYQHLRLEVARLEAPQRIVAEAQRRGMVQPPTVTYLAPSPASSAVGAGRAQPSPDPGGATSWSTVKPHLDARP